MHLFFCTLDKAEAEQGSLTVTLSAMPTALQEGQELALTCRVDGLAGSRQSFSVAWLRNGSELARFGPTGILQVGTEYSDRHTGGELLATKTGTRDHLLVLRPVRVQDQGGYVCRAWPQDREDDESFTQGQYRDSTTQMVHISAKGVSEPPRVFREGEQEGRGLWSYRQCQTAFLSTQYRKLVRPSSLIQTSYQKYKNTNKHLSKATYHKCVRQ